MIFLKVRKAFSSVLKLQNFRCISGTPRKITKSYFFKPGVIPLSSLCIGDVIDQIADKAGDKTAVVSVHQNISKTFLELRNEAERLASGLISLGLRKGDRIGIYSPNCYEWPLMQFAAAKAGLILVNINPAFQAQELEYCLKKVGCKALVSWDEFKIHNCYKIICDVVPELPNSTPGNLKSRKLPNLESVIVISKDKKDRTFNIKDVIESGNKESNQLLSEIGKTLQFDDPASIQFTSGTTGTPKGAVLTHHNLVNNVLFTGPRCGFDSIKLVLCCHLPLFHSYGCVHGSLNILFHQGTCVFPSVGFDAVASLKAIEEHKCTVVFGTPTMYVDMIRNYKSEKFNIGHLKHALIGGAASPFALINDIKEILGVPHIMTGYGMTETSPTVALTKYLDKPESVADGIMELLEYVEVKIIDSDGCLVPVSAQGELCVRGHSTFLGYWNDEKNTTEVLDDARWYHSGDLATMDEYGLIKIVGRIKDMIIRGGENIYPLEVENFLNTHPDIMDAHICSVPDKRMGEEACAWISVKSNKTLTEEEIKKFCKGKISHYKIPRYIMFVEEFPKTQTGKVKKFEMSKISIEKLKL